MNRQKPVAKHNQGAERHQRLAERLQWLCLAGVAALLVATPLLPSDSTPEQDLGAPFILLWLVLLIVWGLSCLADRGVSLRWCKTDLAVGILIAVHSLSALMVVANHSGNARLALNMLWRWIGFAIAYFLMRQLISNERRIRVFFNVMIALAVGLGAMGLMQYIVLFPQQFDAYTHVSEEERQQILRQQGIRDTAIGSPQRVHFENRLLSNEPIATFALANSLAGVLAPWMIAVIAMGVLSWPATALRHRMAIATIYATSIIGFCLLLTKSRSAYLAALCGLLILGLLVWRVGLRLSWKVPVALVALLTVLIWIGIATRSLDDRVIRQAAQSLTYRLEYWQATWAMISDHPWFGCGPGNFQTTYPFYKLPGASETVSEPHNFILEVWATAGTPAMLALVAVIFLWITHLWSGARRDETVPSDQGVTNDSNAAESRAVYGGALSGLLLAFPCGLLVGFQPELSMLLVGLPAAAGSVILIHLWVTTGRISVIALAVPLLVLMINFIAAGGISFPGVALTWWLLIGASLNLYPATGKTIQLSPRSCLIVTMLSAVAAILCQQTVVMPVVRGHGYLAEGDQLLQNEKFEEARLRFQRAKTYDPYSPLPRQRCAYLALADWLDSGARSDSTEAIRFQQLVDEYIRHDPKSVTAYNQIGNWYLSAYRVNRDPGYLQLATKYYQIAAKLYPMSNFHHAQLAWSYYLMDQPQAAAEEAARALQLDALMPHQELRLVNRPVFDGEVHSDTMDTEQKMRLLRNDKDQK